jgi:hypothetical protein
MDLAEASLVRRRPSYKHDVHAGNVRPLAPDGLAQPALDPVADDGTADLPAHREAEAG